jgi:two-component system, chemotaxis family, protein-glutamate methylesterase/glutaminase
VQEPTETPWPSMPESALAHVDVDYTLQAAHIGDLLETLVASNDAAAVGPALDADTLEREVKELTMHEDERDHPGDPSPYSCPDCGGVLWELQDGEMMRFRCRVGHAYTSDSLTSEQSVPVEHALWSALRALEEQAAVRRRIVERMRRIGQETSAEKSDERIREIEAQAQTLRELLLSGAGAKDA